jgi:hypothetical protein
MLSKINPCNFTWQLWRGGTLYDLGVKRYRKEFIIEKTASLRKYAIRYCKGVSLICRPKRDYYAVMFQKIIYNFGHI